MSKLVKDLAPILSTALNGGKPYAFVGFAFGAVLAFECALAMAKPGSTEGPALLCVVSSEGPDWTGRATEQHKLGGAPFEAMLKRKGGTEPILAECALPPPRLSGARLPSSSPTPPHSDASFPRAYVCGRPDLKDLFIPIIKADCELEETYKRAPNKLVSIPTLAIHGTVPGRDQEKSLTPPDAAALWMNATAVKAADKSRVVPVAQDWYMLEDEEGAKALLREVGAFFTKVVAPKC